MARPENHGKTGCSGLRDALLTLILSHIPQSATSYDSLHIPIPAVQPSYLLVWKGEYVRQNHVQYPTAVIWQFLYQRWPEPDPGFAFTREMTRLYLYDTQHFSQIRIQQSCRCYWEIHAICSFRLPRHRRPFCVCVHISRSVICAKVIHWEVFKIYLLDGTSYRPCPISPGDCVMGIYDTVRLLACTKV